MSKEKISTWNNYGDNSLTLPDSAQTLFNTVKLKYSTTGTSSVASFLLLFGL